MLSANTENWGIMANGGPLNDRQVALLEEIENACIRLSVRLDPLAVVIGVVFRQDKPKLQEKPLMAAGTAKAT